MMSMGDVSGTSWSDKARRWQSLPEAEQVAERISRRCNILRNMGRVEEADILEEMAFMENAAMGDFIISRRHL